MVLNQFAIFLDNPAGVYFPGQTVTGRVHVSIANEPKRFEGLTVRFRGDADVHFTRTETVRHNSFRQNHNSGHTETIHYTASERYFQANMPLIPSAGSISMSPGLYEYPFSFILPFGIPSSFEGQHGRVRYTIKATMVRAWKWDHHCKIGFTVNTIVDLNVNPMSTSPSHGTQSKTICCLCCASGPITASAWIDRTGYVPGETIHFKGDTENKSGKLMKGSKVQLIEQAIFRAQGLSEKTTRVIVEKSRGEFGPSDEWTNEPFYIPPIAPSGLPFCNIIDVNYILQYVVDPGSLSFNLTVPLNLIIGNVPLREMNKGMNPPPVPAVMPSAPPMEAWPAATLYPDLPPPRYEDCVFEGIDIRDAEDSAYLNNGQSLLFRPRYASYYCPPPC